MKAVGFTNYLPVEDSNAFLDLDIETPTATGRDILVAVNAVAVNPVDTKVRGPKDKVESPARIIGYDASGLCTGRKNATKDLLGGEFQGDTFFFRKS